ncbi:S-layer homology domain-containing protein [Faecousia sp.]|uniref:S-layer homology domain-containing protein n=1 Tax=Faecousia sp. TaxID=2952921 RepID=UPI003AB2F9A1
MRKLSKTLLSLLLIAAMLASFVVLPAAAEEPAAEQPTEAVQAAETQAADSSFMKIFHLDCGRKYFTKDWILALINEISAAGYTHLQLAIGNDGMRFLLDDMSLTVGDKTYSSEDVAAAIHAGNVAYDNRQNGYTPEKDELTESEMNAIISYATSKGITVIPLINNPGHMDAILSAATSLTGTTCSYNGSVTTINLENEDAVAFTKAFFTKYVKYFAAKGCTHFGIGADEYANDVYSTGSMGFGQLVLTGKYSLFVNYVNEVAAIVSEASEKKMKPVAFNDGFYFNGNTTSGTFSTDIVISFWTSGWGGYQSETASRLAARGHQMINTNGDFYYVLGKSDKFDSGYDYASNFSNTAFMGSTVSNPAGATFCVWCDNPGAETEQEIAQKIRLPLRAMAQRMKGESVVLDENELVSGGFKADGTINTDVDVAEDAATGIKVSAPSVKTVDVTVKTDNLPEVTGAAEVLAWEITPRDADGNAYTGEGTVTLHIPEAWTGANVYGAVVNADGSLTTIKENVALNETENTITFTVPHFSTVLAVKENKTAVINLTVGQTKSVVLKGEDLTGKITKATDFDTYASLNAAYTPSKTETKIGSKLSSLSTGTTIVLTDGKGNYAKLNSSDYLENTTAEAEATIWTIEKSGNNYYLKSGNNYLNPSNSYLQVSYDVSTSKNNSWKWSANGGFYYSPYYYTYYLGYNDSTWGMSTTQGTGIAYGVTTETIDAATTLTFTGVAIGTTYVTVDNIQYKVVVSAEDLKNVTPLTVEYWITNKQVYDGTTYSSSLPTSKDIAAANVHFEEGVLLESLVPATGVNSDSNPMVFWKSTRLASDNKQTTGSGVDKTRSGSDFTYIRYWNGSWSYSADGVNWVNAETGDQFVAYYLQKTEVTKEVETQVVDWGPQRDNWSSLNYLGTKYVLMDYAVKYESGEQVPSTFPTADTLAFHCDTSTTKNNVYYREIGMIRAKETDEYEVYMITLTPTSDTPTDTLKGSTAAGNNSYEYKGTETVVWADTQEDLDASGLGTYTSISGTFTYSIGGEPIVPGVEIYRRQAMKVTYYVRAKVTEDSLTVHYIDKTANREFYSYNIAVAQGTYFNANIGLNKDAWKGPLVNGEVTNLKGNIQTVSADLSTLPALSAQYLYSDYTCVEVTRSTGNTETGTPAGKEVYLYYTFNNKHTFVVDFGVPLKIGPKDINLSETGWTTAKVNNVSEYKALYGTAKISVNEGLTYTLTKPMQGVETLQVTLGKEGEDPATHTIYLVPATTVYYEQNVATYSTGWDTLGTIAPNVYQETQKGRTPGYNFGYDPYYEANQLGAGGSVMCTNTKGADATLTFKGTGMELYLRTQNANATSDPATEANNAADHSYMLVQVYAGDTADANSLKRMSFVDVNNLFVAHGSDKYGYNTPCWTVDGMDYGTYTVVVRYVKGTTYGLAIDGFRVTNTLNPDDATTQNFYAAVHEDNMQTSEIRNMVLKQAEVYNLADNWYKVGNEVIDAVYDAEDAARIINGAVLIKQNYDQNGGTDVQVTSDLVNIGPKNEIYLNPGEAVVMTVPTTYTTVQVGMRSLTGDTVTYQINSDAEKEMKSTVDMYNKVNLAEGKLVIQNVTGGILALTKLKVTGAGTTTNDVSVETTPEAIRYAMALMRGIDVPQFTDVAEDAWYHDYVYDLVYRGVVNGMTATTYEPEGKLTRAQFVKLLACSLADAETLKTYEGKHPFKDSEGHWAEAYIAWAKDKGIVEGVSATEFDPEAPITREQMATIFGRYALKQGIELPKSDNAAGSFPDADKISEYAREFVELMRIAGILNGYEDGTFRPQGNATRAEAAKLFSLFLSITDKLAK